MLLGRVICMKMVIDILLIGLIGLFIMMVANYHYAKKDIFIEGMVVILAMITTIIYFGMWMGI